MATTYDLFVELRLFRFFLFFACFFSHSRSSVVALGGDSVEEHTTKNEKKSLAWQMKKKKKKNTMESGTHTRGYQIHLHSRVLWREHLLLASSSFSYFSLMACCLFIWMVFLSLAVCVCVWRDSTTHWLKRLFAYIYACNNPQMHRYREWMRLMNCQHSDHVSHWFLFDRMVRIHSHSKYSSNRLKNQQVYLHLDICVGRTRAHSNRPQRYVSSAVCFFGVILRFFFLLFFHPEQWELDWCCASGERTHK